jgi:uncharacterized protein YpmS
MKSLGVGCLSALGGLIIGIVLGFGMAQMATNAAPPPLAAPAPSPNGSDVSVTASAAFINSQLQQAVEQSGLGRQAKVTLISPNLIQVAATVDASALIGVPVAVNATVSMRASVRNGRISLSVDKVDAGGVAVPPSVMGSMVEKMRALAEEQVNRMLQRALQGMSLHIVNVRVSPSSMTIDLAGQ